MTKKLIVIIALLGVVSLGVGGYFLFFQSKDSSYRTVEVKKADVAEKVQVTSEVVPDQEINLQFQVGGVIKEIVHNTGEKIGEGDLIVSLQQDDYQAEVLEAEASFNKAKAELDKLVAGASEEEIQVYQRAVESAQADLESAQIDLNKEKAELEETREQAENNLQSGYEDALSVMNSAVTKVETALNDVDAITRAYFNSADQVGISFQWAKQNIVRSLEEMETSVDQAVIDDYQSIDSALIVCERELDSVFEQLKTARSLCEEPAYRNVVTEADKTSLDNHKTYINTVYGDVIDARQTISSTRLSKNSEVNSSERAVLSAQQAVQTAQAKLNKAQAELDKIEAPPSEEEVEMAQAEVERSRALWQKALNNLAKAELVSPCRGLVSEVEKERGESITTDEKAASVICEGGFQVETDIPETEIGGVEKGKSAIIKIDAFPGKEYEGKVVEVEPAETVIQGVVYYKTKLVFEGGGERVRPGMTAEVDIIIDSEKDVLVIPKRAVQERGNEEFVRVVEAGEIKEKEVETGLEDMEGGVEVVSGLSSGEKVITFRKED